MSERPKEHAWKACRRETVSRVRIPPSPLEEQFLATFAKKETGVKGFHMRSIATTLFILLAVAASGCKGKNGGSGPADDRPEPKFIDCPTITIKTTQGDIRVVLFPSQPAMPHYTYFVGKAREGYYNECEILFERDPHGIYEIAVLRNTSDAGGKTLQTVRVANFHPVRGTLCIRQLFRVGAANIHADPYSFVLVRKNLRKFAGKEFRMLAGNMFCIGQTVSGLEVLDKLTKKDTILGIVEGAPVRVSTEKLAKLGTSEIDNFADVLKTE